MALALDSVANARDEARPVLEARGLTVRRDGRPVLEDVSLRVHAGSIHAVVGPNGAGKSTLVSALLGQTEFTGTIERCLAPNGRIGYVPQTFEVDRTLPVTVAEFFALGRQWLPVCLGVRRASLLRAEAALARVGLEGFAARRLGELSGGELRRVLLANAIDPEPELLVLDEPGAGLDAASAERLDALVAELRDGGAAILIVSHDRRQVRRLADRVTWIDCAVRATGTAAHVLAEERAAEALESDAHG